MILADKIINERKKNGWSQEELAEMLSVSRQSVSKWESAQAVPDLQRIIKMAEIFGVSTDYLLKDDIEETETVINTVSESGTPIKQVSLEEASKYIELVRRNTPSAVIATMLFVICPVPLIFLAGLSKTIPQVTETMAAAFGIVALLLAIVGGVVTWIVVEAKEKDYQYLKNIDFETQYGVDGTVAEKRKAFESKRIALVAIATALCILCPIGVIVAGIVKAPDIVIISAICLLLILVAIAVGMFVYTSRIEDSYKLLLGEFRMTESERKADRLLGHISGAYWCIVVAIFLVVGLAFGRWEFAGVIFPVAGVLYAAIMGIAKIFLSKE